MNKNIFFYRVLFLLHIALGIKMYFRGTDGRFGIEVPPFAALLFTTVGLFLFLYTFFADKKKFTPPDKMVCVNCSRKYKGEHVEIPVCPKCDGELVPYNEQPQKEKT